MCCARVRAVRAHGGDAAEKFGVLHRTERTPKLIAAVAIVVIAGRKEKRGRRLTRELLDAACPLLAPGGRRLFFARSTHGGPSPADMVRRFSAFNTLPLQGTKTMFTGPLKVFTRKLSMDHL